MTSIYLKVFCIKDETNKNHRIILKSIQTFFTAASTMGSGMTGDSSHDIIKASPSHRRQKSVDSTFSANLTDSGLASSNTPSDISATAPSGFRPLSMYSYTFYRL